MIWTLKEGIFLNIPNMVLQKRGLQFFFKNPRFGLKMRGFKNLSKIQLKSLQSEIQKFLKNPGQNLQNFFQKSNFLSFKGDPKIILKTQAKGLPKRLKKSLKNSSYCLTKGDLKNLSKILARILQREIHCFYLGQDLRNMSQKSTLWPYKGDFKNILKIQAMVF